MIPSWESMFAAIKTVYQRGWMIDSQPDWLYWPMMFSISKGMDD